MLAISTLTSTEKERRLKEAIGQITLDGAAPGASLVDLDVLAAIPNCPLAYWIDSKVLDLFRTAKANFEPSELQARAGLRTLDDFRFLRLLPEVSPLSLRCRNWVFHLKGGPFQRYYAAPHLLCFWREDGREIKALAHARYGSVSRIIQAQDYYFRRGLTYTRRTSSRLSVRVAPEGCNFADRGPLIVGIPDTASHLILLTRHSQHRHRGIHDSGGLAAGEGAARSYEVGLIQRLPQLDIPV